MDLHKNVLAIERNPDEFARLSAILPMRLDGRASVTCCNSIEAAVAESGVIPYDTIVICTQSTDQGGAVRKMIDALRRKAPSAKFVLYGYFPRNEGECPELVARVYKWNTDELIAAVLKTVSQP